MSDIPRLKPSVGERRGQQVPPLNTNLSRPSAGSSIPAPWSHRSRTKENPSNGYTVEPAPKTPVRRLSSKSSLRSFFTRDKSAHKSSKDDTLTEIEEGQQPARQRSHEFDAPLSPDLCPTPKTVVSTKSLVSSPLAPVTTHLTKPPPKPHAETGDTTPGLTDRGWRPPPLFQAYPQAIKDACLWAPALSADYILRIQATKRREQDGRATANGDTGDWGRKKDEKKRHLRSLSETIGRTEWGQKVFVLATSGYILQYAGGGKNDRLPEKMLQLGPKSVAFASDAIPGKHFVLQVSQSMEDDDNDSTAPSETPKSLRSRFGFHRSPARRLVRSFLLVFETPERMNSWLLAARAEIEARGGRKYVSERSGDEDDELRPKPTVRQMVKRDPNRYSKVYLQPQPAGNADETEKSTQLSIHSRRSSYISFNRRSLVRTESRESQLTARTDNPAPTNITEPSFASTMLGSSAHDNFATSPPLGSEASYSTSQQEDNTGTPVQSPPLSSPNRRRSLLMYNKGPIPTSESTRLPRTPSDASKTFPTRSTSPPAPNFSVPSFSRRFTAKPGQPPTSGLPHPPQGRYGSKIAAFPSPPQSPIKSTPSFDRSDNNDKNALSPVHKALRGSNSEASLTTTTEFSPKTRDPRTKASPRIPKPITTSTTPTSPQHSTNTPPDRQTDLPLRRDPSRTPTTSSTTNSRLSTIYQNTTSSSSSSGPNKRKSMPGLTGLGIVNPPSMPPPNYPLPKLPSPVKSTANPAWPDNSAPRGAKSPPAPAVGTGTATGIPVQRGASRKGSAGTVGSSSSKSASGAGSGVSSPRAVAG